MATIVAAAGGGNWQTDATWVGGVKPTAADDVQLDATSGNVTIDSGAVCRSLDCGGYTGTLTHTASVTLTIGDGTAGTGNRALRLASGMTYTLGSATTSQLSFVSTSTTSQSVDLVGKTAGYVLFNGAAGSWAVTSAVAAYAVVLAQGTLDLSSATTVSASFFFTDYTSTRTVTLGSAAITLSLAATAWDATRTTGLTVTANTATVTLTGAAATFSGGAKDWNGMSVVMSGSGAQNVTAGGTFANFTRTGTAVTTDSLTLTTSGITCTGTCTLTGNSATNRVLVASAVLGTARTITAANVALTNVDFRDITGAGAATWSGTSVKSALGNTNITFDAPLTITHNAGAAGNWSTAANWDGGVVPTCQDTVIIPATTTGTLTNDMPRMCADLTCTGYTGRLTQSTATEIYGSITLGSGMTFTAGAAAITLMGRSSHTITSAGLELQTVLLTINSIGGTYTLADAMSNHYSATSVFTLTAGTFSDGGFTVSFNNGRPNWNGGTANLTGTWNLAYSATGTIWNWTAGTMNASTATFVLAASTTNRTFTGGSANAYGTITYTAAGSTGSLTISGANGTYTTINFSDITNARTLNLPTSSGITVTNFNVNGTAGKLMTLTGDVTKAEGTVSCDYLAISSSDATGGAYFYAGANSTDGGTNTGWIFGAPSGGRPFKGGTATVKESDIEGALVIL